MCETRSRLRKYVVNIAAAANTSFASCSSQNNAEADPRVGKINLAVKTVISVKDLVDLGTGTDAECKEAVARVRKAQVLIGDFLEGSGVKDERVTKYISAHR